jgi:protein tyrosine phosphatase (PTP) superfamily phosphohydrolase (DUF442 family)
MRYEWKTLSITAAIAVLIALSPAPAALAAGTDTFGISGATFPEPGLMAAGQPTGEQLQLLAEEGYKTVIDLRAPEEPHGFDEPEAARQNGLAYVNVPVNLNILDAETIDQFLDAMKKAKRPAILHSSSPNRVGALYYAWLVLEKKVPAGEALEKAKAAGLRQSTLIRKMQQLVAEHKPPAPK